jgi:hypothetical protein
MTLERVRGKKNILQNAEIANSGVSGKIDSAIKKASNDGTIPVGFCSLAG